MKELVAIQKQLVPEMTDMLHRRYRVLASIHDSGAVGRRVLAASLQISERTLRGETEFLHTQELIHVDRVGMVVTEQGRKLLEQLEPYVKELSGLTDLEQALCDRFHLRQAIVIAGDSDLSEQTKQELGRAGAKVLQQASQPDDIIAVAGGSTMAQMANQLTAAPKLRDCVFVPARGGLGESLGFQANAIASMMAQKTGGTYRMLHVPDQLSEDAYQSLIQEPDIQDVLVEIRRARVAIHGIGEALLMAKRRRAAPATVQELTQCGAVAEAFGYYFDRQGEVVYRMPTLGLRLEDIHQMETVIAIAGGTSKAAAIAAILDHGHEDVLVTDEAVAHLIMSSLTEDNRQ